VQEQDFSDSANPWADKSWRPKARQIPELRAWPHWLLPRVTTVANCAITTFETDVCEDGILENTFQRHPIDHKCIAML